LSTLPGAARRWLTPAGALAALAVGAAVTSGAGARGLVVLAAFFVTSSLLTPGGGRRTAVQVVANGGVAALAALLSPFYPALRVAFVGALSAAAADTWATEIGMRSGRTPRLLTTWRPVPPGTSGGVTLSGSLGGVAGAATVSLAALAVGFLPPMAATYALVAGILGALADSLCGATVQSRYRCPWCGEVTELRRHPACGVQGVPAGGVPGMNNDAVNLVATMVGATAASLPVILAGHRLAS
jgi:uncharacterized protein (TIGR00297 family)